MSEEWRHIFKHKFLLLIIVMVALIPSIYSNVFLGSVWNPYQEIGKLPVAVINKDEGTKIGNKDMNVGRDFVEELKRSKTLDYHFLDNEQEAIDELNKGKYYMVLKIDKDFSENAGKILNKAPLKMKLDYTINPGLNFISTKITDTAMKDIQKELVKSVQGTYLKLLFDNMDNLKEGYVSVTEGTKQINDGTDKILDGEKKMADGIKNLSNGTDKLGSGSGQLYSGIVDYTNGVGQLQNGLSRLNTGSNELLSGAYNYTNEITNGTSKLSEGINRINNGLGNLSSAMPNGDDISRLNEALDGLNKGASDLKVGNESIINYLSMLNNGIGELNAGQRQLSQNLDGLDMKISGIIENIAALFPQEQQAIIKAKLEKEFSNSGLTNIKPAIDKLAAGSEQLSTSAAAILGNRQENTGIYKLYNGIDTIQIGLSKYSEPQKKLNNGILTLANGLKGKDGLIDGIQKLTDGIDKLNAGASYGGSKLVKGISSYINGVAQANTGVDDLQRNSINLVNGAYDLNAATKILTSGVRVLGKGSDDLLTGTESLKEGTESMYDKLKDASDKMVDYSFGDDNVSAFKDPLTVNRHETSVIVNNGHALAPYMMTISLFIGAIGICMVFPFNRRRYSEGNIFKWWLSKISIFIIEALLQAGFLILTLKMFLGLSPLYLKELFIVALFASMAFISIASFFILNFGSIGKFLTIIILVLQLATAEGTYPLALSAKGFKLLSPYMPATYSIKGMKQAISINGDITVCLGILAIFIVIFLVLTPLCVFIGRSRSWKFFENTDKV